MTERRSFPFLLVVLCLVGLGAALITYVRGLAAEIDTGAPSGGIPSLHEAAERGDLAAIQVAAKQPASLDQPLEHGEGARRGMTPLMCAATAGKTDAVQALIKAGAKVDAPRRDGKTALMLAVIEGNAAAAQALVDAKARVDARSNENWTAAMFAASRGDASVLRALLASGANVEFSNKWGQTALMIASQAGDPEKIKILLEARSPLNTTDGEGATAVAYAASSESPAGGLQLLIDSGADPKLADKSGLTPLMRAADRADQEKLAILLKAGAPTDSKDASGRTAAEWALARDDELGKQAAKLLGGGK